MVKNDMEIWEKSKQWPLSCYTYTKEEPSFPGKLNINYQEVCQLEVPIKAGFASS